MEAVFTSRENFEDSFVGTTARGNASCEARVEEAGGMEEAGVLKGAGGLEGAGGVEEAGGMEETGGVEETAGVLVIRSGVAGAPGVNETSGASNSHLGFVILDLSLGPWPPALTLIFLHLSYTRTKPTRKLKSGIKQHKYIQKKLQPSFYL